MNKCPLKKIIKHNKKLLISSILFSKLLLNYIKFQYELINEKMVVKVKAKKCDAGWQCKGEDRCRKDCETRYNGIGRCDDITAPLVPKQCYCVYNC
ncbi:hypothetical protein CsSME_00011024 [Camellia sinensis var. sinensis]